MIEWVSFRYLKKYVKNRTLIVSIQLNINSSTLIEILKIINIILTFDSLSNICNLVGVFDKKWLWEMLMSQSLILLNKAKKLI